MQFIARRDEDTVEVRARGGAKLPSRGWLRPKSDSGTPPQLARQTRARQALQHQAATVRSIRDPVSYHLSRGYWRVDGLDLEGNTPDVIRDMLALEPFYALQGPPGSGKTTAASHALALYLSANRGARVLVSSQSNFALDNLAARLIQSVPHGLLVLREVAEGRETTSVSADIQPYTADQLTITLTKNVVAELTASDGPAVGQQDADRHGSAAGGAGPYQLITGAVLTDEERGAAEAALAAEWLASVQGDQVELESESGRERASCWPPARWPRRSSTAPGGWTRPSTG